MGSCMDVHTGDRVDVCRAVRKAVCGVVRGAVHGAVRKAVCRDDCTAINRIGGGYTADCRTFLYISAAC